MANKEDQAILANTSTVTMGAVTLTVSLHAVSESGKPTWDSTNNRFNGTALTDANGVSKYWTGAAAVPYDATNKVGVAQVKVTATSSGTLAADLKALYGSDSDHQFTLTITPEGQMVVAKSAGDESDGLFIGEGEGKRTSALALETSVPFTCALDSEGGTSEWSFTFYYATRVHETSDEDTSAHHTGDLLNFVISGVDGAA